MTTFIIRNPRTNLSKELRIVDCPIDIIQQIFDRYTKANYEVDLV